MSTLTERCNALISKSGGSHDAAVAEQIIAGGVIPDGALVYVHQTKGDVTYHGDHVCFDGVRQPAQITDTLRESLLIQYAVTASLRGTHIG